MGARLLAALAAVLSLAAVIPAPLAGGGGETPRPSDGVPTFTDVALSAGLTGGGNFFAWGDYDNDGDEDLLVDGGRLFRNNGPPGWSFTDVTSAAGISGGGNGNWADYDNDGFLDFYQVGPNTLWRNDGDGTFSDVTASAGNPTSADPTGVVAWADYDRDGDVDLFFAGAEGAFGVYYRDHLYRNDAGIFIEVTTAAMGNTENNSPKYGRGAAWGDYNDDGWLDLYVTNYRQLPNYLWRNNQDGTFTDVAPPLGLHNAPVDAVNNPDPCNRAGHGVGSSWADYDNDGDLDILVGTFNHKDWRTSDDTQLWRATGAPGYTFTNVRATAGIPVKPYDLQSPPNPYCGSSMGNIWTGPQGDELIVGATWGDVDSDGDLDLWMPQIYDINYAISYLYSNDGDGTFTEIGATAGTRVIDTYGGAFADYDQDGDPDLISGGRLVVDGESRIRLFRNNGVAGGHKWLEVRVESCGGGVNTAAIGARLELTAGMMTLMRNLEAGQSSHSAQNSMVQHFGLGHYSGTTADLSLRLPDGTTLALNGLAVNTLHTFLVNCPVDPVENPTATLTGASQQHVTLSWSPPASGEGSVQSYALFSSTAYDANGAGYALLASIPKGTYTYLHSNAGKGNPNTYFYRIVTVGVTSSTAYPRQLGKFAATLWPGANLLSIPLDPFDPTAGAVLSTLDPFYEIVRTYNASDAADPWARRRGAGPDDLSEIHPGMGLWVHISTFSLVPYAVTGLVPNATAVNLRQGWNLVGYTSFTARPVATAFAGIAYTRVEAFDANLPPYYLKALTPAQNLEMGKAYWVHVTADAAWTVAF